MLITKALGSAGSQGVWSAFKLQNLHNKEKRM